MLINRKSISTYKKLLNYLSNVKIKLSNASAIEQFSILEDMYYVIREYSLLFFEEDKTSFLYKNIIDIMGQCERLVSSIYLSSDSKSYEINEFVDVYSIETLLDYIVTNVRKKLINQYLDYTKSTFNLVNPSITIDQVDLSAMCYTVSMYVKQECDVFGIKCNIVQIGNNFSGNIGLNKPIHYFNIIELQGKKYLIDLSYSQFFKQNSDNLLSRLGIPYISLCNPGIYMMRDNKRNKTAKDLLSRGWIYLTEENIKNYFDGFTLSLRNGLYYELLGKVDYSTNYTSSDYLKFLDGCDSVLNHEPKEGLGIQKRPLKDPHINFSKK